MQAKCPCASAEAPADIVEATTAFYELREACQALRMSIPEGIVNEHRAFTTADLDDANHASVPFLAYRRGRLLAFTEALHELAIEAGGFRREVTTQYRRDLQETWLLEKDSISRFKKSRNYLSRLTELEFALWLRKELWRLNQLELYGGNFDIEANSPEQVATAFEVKFLAQREVVFELNRAAFQTTTAGHLGVYSPVDYLVFRLFEAAVKLKESSARRIAVAIVSDYQISYQIPLSENWVDWKRPKFLRRDTEIDEFLAKQYAANPGLDADMESAIPLLGEIWIMHYNAKGLELAHRIEIS